ncbi:Transmembrane protein 180 [Acipenser ruthenus]|uniref:Transmembrane protein 180 n=1 Tax=Acipenser ruthenus TaxID=7906 RepID=A0A444V4Y4_ACIRT|nr:Transmembrane protein 180 [Acipenser ruthenus]
MARRVWSCFSSISTAVLYGSLSLFVSILHNVFLLYYVDTFVSVYKIDKVSFWVGERRGSDLKPTGGSEEAAGSVTDWPPVCTLLPGFQFLVCLCLYDGFLTVVDLNHNALLADLAVSASERTRLNFQCSLFSALGSLSVFMSYSFWDKEDFFSFRMFCVALAALSILGFSVACWLLRQRFQGRARRDEEEDSVLKELCVGQAPLAQEKELTLGQYLKQLSKHTNFLWFASMNLVQVFHCHFNSNFFPLFLEHLLSDRISASTGSFLLGFSYIAPHLNNLYFLSLCGRYGVYTVVRWLFFLKLILSVIMLLAGPDQIYLLCIFIASNRVFTEGTCKLLNLVISDLVDEDLVMNRRQQAASALLFGMVALLTLVLLDVLSISVQSPSICQSDRWL